MLPLIFPLLLSSPSPPSPPPPPPPLLLLLLVLLLVLMVVVLLLLVLRLSSLLPLLPLILLLWPLLLDLRCVRRHMFWLSSPFLVSEREPHCVLERGLQYSKALRDLLEPRGWVEVSNPLLKSRLFRFSLPFKRRTPPEA